MTVLPAWIERLEAELVRCFGTAGRPVVAIAPGRVNLIGEHTDYNDGFVLPMAIDRWVGTAFAPRTDRRLRARSVVFGDRREIDLGELTPAGGADWFSYICGALWALREAGHDPVGMDLVVDGDVPLGSGLSSSSALTMCVLRAACGASGIGWETVAMALLGQRAERGFVGVEGGVMDQFTAAAGREGHALLLDCRSLDARFFPLADDAVVVVMDTGASRTLAGSAYNDRSRACRRAVAAIREIEPGIRALRDVGPDLLEASRDRLDETTYRRALHVVGEMGRPAELAGALASGDLGGAGRLMDASHASLRDLYEVSSRELDLVTDLARQHPACFGTRLTGAGFGGCAIALVSADGAPDFIDEVHAAYRAEVDLPSSFFACRAVDGARML